MNPEDPMSFVELLQSPDAWAIAVLVGGVVPVLKRQLRARLGAHRDKPEMKLGLMVVAGLLGVLAIPISDLLSVPFFPDLPQADRLVGGLLSSLPAMVGHDALKQIGQIPWLPPQVGLVIELLIQRSEQIEKDVPFEKDVPDLPEGGRDG